MSELNPNRASGLERFSHARWQAFLDRIRGRLSGRQTDMLPFEAIRANLRDQNPRYEGVCQVLLDQIVGSVGRYQEFTRKFLPLTDSIQERWVGVENLAHTGGWPPIELYRVGEVYFVTDGNHRLSVAREFHMDTIEAHVWSFPETAVLHPDDSLDDILISMGEARFMERTALNKRRPDHGIRFTTPRQYEELLAQIAHLGQTLAQIDGEPMPYFDLVDAWYEMIYLPTIQIIRESDLLNEFPGRTESDLFVWFSRHREGLRAEYGEYNSLAELAEMLAKIYKENEMKRLRRQVRRLLGGDAAAPLSVTAVEPNPPRS